MGSILLDLRSALARQYTLSVPGRGLEAVAVLGSAARTQTDFSLSHSEVRRHHSATFLSGTTLRDTSPVLTPRGQSSQHQSPRGRPALHVHALR